MCIGIVKIWFGIVDGQILSIFDAIICPPRRILSFCIFSSPGQRARRAIGLPSVVALASESTNVKVFVKVFDLIIS